MPNSKSTTVRGAKAPTHQPSATNTTRAPRATASYSKAQVDEMAGHLAAVNKVRAVVEYAMDGTVLVVNPNFLQLFGYTADEVVGKHDSMFLPSGNEQAAEHRQQWEQLRRGEPATVGQYRRVTKDGRELWMQGYYVPILGPRGEPLKVVNTPATSRQRSSACTISSRRPRSARAS